MDYLLRELTENTLVTLYLRNGSMTTGYVTWVAAQAGIMHLRVEKRGGAEKTLVVRMAAVDAFVADR